VLCGLSLRILRNDFLALLGANGSGKTTLLRTLLGFIRPRAGTIALFGRPFSERRSGEARNRIGYVPQNRFISPRMPLSVREVVSIGRYRSAGIGKPLSREDRACVDRALEWTGIAALSSRPVGMLSGGEQQKVQIARVLCQEPELLLLDEPTANLDLGAVAEMQELFERIRQGKHIATVVVMHDLESLPTACNRAVILAGGEKKFEGAVSEIFHPDNLRFLYGDSAPRVEERIFKIRNRRAGTP
jgi:ABC-type cobalamin/Fe3+-siderophores transport system ATPase subunit